jgi:hypothetical protein
MPSSAGAYWAFYLPVAITQQLCSSQRLTTRPINASFRFPLGFAFAGGGAAVGASGDLVLALLWRHLLGGTPFALPVRSYWSASVGTTSPGAFVTFSPLGDRRALL